MEPKKRPNLGVMIGGVHASFPRGLIRGISDQMEQEEANVFFFLRIHTRPFFSHLLGNPSSNQYDYQFNTIFDYSKVAGLDGTIIGFGTIGLHMDNVRGEDFIGRYNDIPLVIVTERMELPNCSSIISDNRQGMAELTRHFVVEHGCKKILFMRGPWNNTDANERLLGFLDVMAEYGLTVTNDMIGLGDFSSSVDAVVERLLDKYPDADAFLFSNDEMASSGYRVMEKRGLRIGKDIHVGGYDNADISAQLTPPLSTVLQNSFGMGKRAVQNMLAVLNGSVIREERYPTQLVLRESCGCLPEKIQSSESTDYAGELEHMRLEAAMREQEYMEYQGKSWFIPIMARELSECTEDEQVFCRLTMENLQRLNARAAYLFLMDQPVDFDGRGDWECPDNLRLAASFRQGEIQTWKTGDRPKVTGQQGIAQFTDDGEKHQFTVYLLFSAERQYGLLVCDVPVQDISFFYIVSLQLGLSLRYFEMNRQEIMRRRAMTRDMEVIRQQNKKLGVLSGYDELTGLLNRRGLREQVVGLCERKPMSNAFVVYCDMDRLKEINDTFGHNEGNQALQACADILRRCIRGTDFLARMGGDEFVCLVVSGDAIFPETFRERLEYACVMWNRESGKPYDISISVGVAPLQLRNFSDFEEASAVADRRMYEYKKLKRKNRGV